MIGMCAVAQVDQVVQRPSTNDTPGRWSVAPDVQRVINTAPIRQWLKCLSVLPLMPLSLLGQRRYICSLDSAKRSWVPRFPLECTK